MTRGPSRHSDDFRGTDRFEILRRIGTGGFGFVYEVWDHERAEKVALKTLRSPTPATILMLKNEFRVVQDIGHPNLVRLGELVEHRGVWFFTMEFVQGVGFTQYVRPAERDTIDSDLAEVALRGPDSDRSIPSATFDEARLRSVLGQLVRGLSMLHAASKVHRDVKPSNVLVERSGRVVLLDFGVVADLAASSSFVEIGVTGTAHFMAPEQAASETVGPAADWYAVGVILFRALTGRLPFAGTNGEVLEAKLLRDAPDPASLASGIPEDLRVLCIGLLKADPQDRPTGPEILERLEGPAARAEVMLAMASRTFVGRTQERQLLASSFRSVLQGRRVTVVVHGESGIGKSFLVNEFVRETVEAESDVVVLTGRCYEQESVPFKAVDGVVDRLSEYLLTLTDEAVERMAPPQSLLIAKTFPVLSRLARATSEDEEIANPRERRTRVFTAFRELLANVARRAPVIIVLHDLQWADADSIALIGEVFEPTQMPNLLLVVTTRLDPLDLAQRFGAVMAERGDLTTIAVGKLPIEEARELARTLLGRLGGGQGVEERIDAIVREADGHPPFIGDLAERVLLEPNAPLRLADTLALRIAGSDAVSQRLLEVVAVAGLPLPEDVLIDVAVIDRSGYQAIAAALRSRRLLDSSGSGRATVVDVFHERVREAALSMMGAERRRQLHRDLGLRLEQRGNIDAEVLAHHWEEAGDPVRATALMVRAADAAAASLAFGRAARLYGAAAARTKDDEATARSLQRKEADALANAGFLAHAAEVRVALAERAEPLDALDLRRIAAEQFLCSGHFERGVEQLSLALSFLGERFPKSPVATIFWLLVTRLVLRLRGLAFTPNPAGSALNRGRARIDTLWSAGAGFSMTDSARGAYFLARSLVHALNLGDPLIVAHALLMETFYLSAEGKKAEARVARFIRTAETVAENLNDPAVTAVLAVTSGWTKYMFGDSPGSLPGLCRGEELLRDRVVGFRYQLAATRTVLYRAYVSMGRFEELRRRIPPVVREAMYQGDEYLLANVRANPLVWIGLADDAPYRVERDLALAEKTLAPKRFLLQHNYVFMGRVNTELYRGDALAAYERTTSVWPKLVRSLLLRIQPVRAGAYELRVRVAIATIQKRPSDERRLLKEAATFVRLLEKVEVEFTDGLAAHGHALIAMAEGDRDAARTWFKRAVTLFDASGLGLYAAAARSRLARLVGGDVGKELDAHAMAWAQQEGVVNPAKLFQTIAPVNEAGF